MLFVALCVHHCSALERNKLGIITALTKDATIEEKISEARLAYEEYAKRLKQEPDVIKLLQQGKPGSVVSLNQSDTDADTDCYEEIIKGNFGLSCVVMNYVAKLLENSSIEFEKWRFINGKDKSDEYHFLVVYQKEDKFVLRFDDSRLLSNDAI